MAKQIRRHNEKGVELREDSTKQPVVTGYAAVYNSEIHDEFWDMYEVILPGAFDRALREKHDVRALVDHDPSLILARTKSNTLQLSSDAKGLYTEFEPANTQAGRDIVESLRRKDVDGMSFGFIPRGSNWKMRDGSLVYEITDVDLWDVSVVTFPAYPATSAQLRASFGSVEIRSLEEIIKEGKDKIAEQMRDETAQLQQWLDWHERYLAHLSI